MTTINTTKNRIIETPNGKKYKKPSIARNIIGIAAGLASYKVLSNKNYNPINLAFNIPYAISLKNKSLKNKEYGESVQKAFDLSGLKDKGVEIVSAIPENKEKITDIVSESLQRKMKGNIDEKAIKEIAQEKVNNAIKGFGAFFDSGSNKIITNPKISWTTFHEMGHGINQNINKLGKILVKAKTPFAFILPTLALSCALIKRKKVKGEKPKNKFDKATTFIKKHCGAIGFLSLAPMLAEEGLASVHGLNLAKKAKISPEALKSLKKGYLAGWLSYAGIAVCMGTSIKIASKIKDKIAKPKEIKKIN